MIEAAIFAILSGSAGISAIVGSRIYPVLMPEVDLQLGAGVPPSYPALSFFTVDTVDLVTLDRTAGAYSQRIQVDAWGNTYKDVSLLAKQVQLAMEAAFGYFETPDGSLTIDGIIRDNKRDLYEKETRSYHCASDFLVMYNAPGGN